ncbi:Maf family protein [Thalassotalea algicola]|nr:Maf family protein [Thalassotalea algicola]
MNLILASQSPRRKSLLTQLGYQFSCQPANIDECVLANESPHDYVERLAKEKAQCVASCAGEESVVLGSDTTVVVNGEILGKPADFDDFSRMMASISGTSHQVLTGIAAVSRNKVLSSVIQTNVFFKQLSSNEIEHYWQSGEPQDKAGGYGIQGIGGQFVIEIQGSYSAVVGLPMYETVALLAHFGVVNAING